MSVKNSTDRLVETQIPIATRSPTPLIFAAALCKLFMGPLSMVFAGMAILVDADMARMGTGFWAGALATVAGALGIHAKSREMIPVGFVACTGLSLGASAISIVLAGTGLAHDSVPVGHAWPSALAANAVVLGLATVDCLASIVALAVEFGSRRSVIDDDDRGRLVRWLHTQRYLIDPVFNPHLNKTFKPHPYKMDSQFPAVIITGPVGKKNSVN